MQCEAVLLGRAPSDGAVDASSLAVLVRNLLVSRSFATRRYLIRCQDALEFVPHRTPRRRRQDDEGFESDNDDDASSTKSLGSDDTVSNSSSCCFVDDHVFKTSSLLPANNNGILRAVTVTSTSSVGTDSANSSGASDTDDLEGLNHQESKPPYQNKPNVEAVKTATFQRSISEDGVETFPISDVVFCHTDPQFPKVAVWVVKKSGSGLETLVFECKNSENLKKICSTFQEVSRRSKLDQFTHTNRRKDVNTSLSKNIAFSKAAIVNKLKENHDTANNTTASSKSTTISKPSNGDKGGTLHSTNTIPKTTNSTTSTLTPLSSVLVKSLAPQTLPKPQQQQQTIIRTLKDTTDAITQFSKSSLDSSPSFPKIKSSNNSVTTNPDILPLRAITKPIRVEEIPHMSKFNLVQRTDGDGVTHIEISRGIKDDLDADGEDSNGPSSILSINTPDIGNFHSLVEKSNKSSRFSKEIESVIRSDIDSNLGGGQKKEVQRQRQPAILVLPENSDKSLRKVWTSNDEGERSENGQSHPPLRPERRRYIKKKNQAPEPPKHQMEGGKQSNGERDSSKLGKEQLDSLKVKGTQLDSRKSAGNQQKIVKGQFIRVSVDQPQSLVMPVIQQGGAWGYTGSGNLVAYSPSPWASHGNNRAPRRKSVEDIFQSSQKYHQQYPKSRSYRSKSPPARPMAYRYIDTVPQSSSTLSKRFFGVSQKLKEIGGSVVNSQYATSARRRNSIGELAYAAQQNANAGGNLKSVIKKANKGRMGEYQEPKKVTFSAYATVQVVD